MKQEQMQQAIQTAIAEQTTILNFFKSRFPLFHNSNFFFRDVQFTLHAFFELKGKKLGYTECEYITNAFLQHLEQQQLAVKISDNGWKLHHEQYKTGAAEQAETAKTA